MNKEAVDGSVGETAVEGEGKNGLANQSQPI